MVLKSEKMEWTEQYLLFVFEAGTGSQADLFRVVSFEKLAT